jgi:hypothetical protein
MEWDSVDLALVGAHLGMVAGVLFCCCQMLMSLTHELHMPADETGEVSYRVRSSTTERAVRESEIRA